MTEKFDRKEEVLYNEKWIPKKYFRVFVYKNGEKVLADNYDEYQRLKALGYSDDENHIDDTQSLIDETTLDDLLDSDVDENESPTDGELRVRRARKSKKSSDGTDTGG